jgi:mannose-1-phosphate guanylyltransferase/phosphomannomutase
MKAVIMAGGFGSRLYPLTVQCPKPMVPFVNKPVLAHVINLLQYHGFSEVVITVQYLANQIQDYFGDGSHLGMTIHYAREEKPLGTAGSVKNAQQYIGNETCLVMSGDAITDIDLSKVLQFHHQKRSQATLVLKQIDDPREYGVVTTDAEGRIRDYIEKPKNGFIPSHTVNTGIYVLEPELFDYINPDEVCDFSRDVFPALLQDNRSVYGYLADGYWCDMGTLPTYLQAMADMLAGKVQHIDPKIQMGCNRCADQSKKSAMHPSLYQVALEAGYKLAGW